VQAVNLLCAQRVSRSPRIQLGLPKGLGRIDVSEPCQPALIGEKDLERAAAGADGFLQAMSRKRWVQRVPPELWQIARTRALRTPPHLPQMPGILKHQSPVGKQQAQVGMTDMRSRRFPKHSTVEPEVEQERTRLQFEQKPFAATTHTADSLTAQRAQHLSWRLWAAIPDLGMAPAGPQNFFPQNQGTHGQAQGFDFGQFRHMISPWFARSSLPVLSTMFGVIVHLPRQSFLPTNFSRVDAAPKLWVPLEGQALAG
jgi:hypothetical protein